MIKTAVAIIGFIAAVFGIIQGLHWGYIEFNKKVKEPLPCLSVTLPHEDAELISGVKNEPSRGNLYITPQGFQGKSALGWRIDLATDCTYKFMLRYAIHESRPLKVIVQHQENPNWNGRTEPKIVSERAFTEWQVVDPRDAIDAKVQDVALEPTLKLKRGRNWIRLETIDNPLPHIKSARLVP